MNKKKIVVFTGAGVSAESGIPVFRGNEGLWEKHKIEDVATPQAFERNPELVLNFYNKMRTKLKEIKPNGAHAIIAELEGLFDVTVVTQNIDDLHERAGSTKIIHLHGELLKSRSTMDPNLKYPCVGDIRIGDVCEEGSQLRPDIVWFEETVYGMDEAGDLVSRCDLLLVVGTSLNVWPAAGLLRLAQSEVFVIDPIHVSRKVGIVHLAKKAVEGMQDFKARVTDPERVWGRTSAGSNADSHVPRPRPIR